MLNCFMKRPFYVNNSLRDYCNKKTNESIRKLTEKYNLEGKSNNLKTLLNEDDNNVDPDFNYFPFLLFLSISTIAFYFYKRLK